MTVRYDHIVANPGDISELAIRPALEYVIEFVRQGRVSDPVSDTRLTSVNARKAKTVEIRSAASTKSSRR